MNLFRNYAGNAKFSAQQNLCGRTHYVDDDTLRYHKSRIVMARAVCNDLFFVLVTSDALDYQNKSRGFRYVIFDIFGHVVARPTLEQAFRTSKQATKALWAKLGEIDARDHTFKAIEQAKAAYLTDMETLRSNIEKLGATDDVKP